METIGYIVLMILWWIYSSLNGISDSARDKNIKPFFTWKWAGKHFFKFTMERIFAGALLICALWLGYYGNTVWFIILGKLVTMAIGMILTFSFWHNGFYYAAANKADNRSLKSLPRYPGGFWHKGKSSTAGVSMSLKFRILALFFGFLLGWAWLFVLIAKY